MEELQRLIEVSEKQNEFIKALIDKRGKDEIYIRRLELELANCKGVPIDKVLKD